MAAKIEESGIPWWLVLLEGIFAIIIGALLLTNTGMTTVVLVQILGIYWLISGIFSLVSIFLDKTMWGWKLFIGILGIIAGFIVLDHPLWSPLVVGSVLIIILGIQGLVIGIVRIIQAFKGAGWGAGILGVISMLFGIFLLANIFIATLALPTVIGIFAIIGGIVAVIMAFRLR